jgi:hypothetical protein
VFTSRRVWSSYPRVVVQTVVVITCEAVETYMGENRKWGRGDHKNQQLLDKLKEVQDDSQLTSLESQLIRSLKKAGAKDRKGSIQKYMSIYATVPPSKVHPTVWKAAQDAIK